MVLYSQMRVKARLNLHKVERLLEERGWSKYRLSRLAGLSYGHVIMLLQGQRQNPSIATVAKLAQAIGVPIEELLEEEEDGVVTH